MDIYLIILSFIILTCIVLNKWTSRLGIPVLIAFIMLGVLCGWAKDINRDAYPMISNVCNFALIFIIFYGGFGTRWKTAKPVAAESILLASLGVVLTAAFTGIFCHLILRLDILPSLLIGAVVSSTDAASVFSILRSHKLGLKNGTAPLLEMESGSNDPFAYLLTIIVLSLMESGQIDVWHTLVVFFKQIVFGVLGGMLMAQAAILAIRKVRFNTSGFESLFILAVMFLSYAVPSSIGGNGFLSVYLVGITLGNINFEGRKKMVNFYDGVTGLMQMILFFILGLMAHPDRIPKMIPGALVILLFMIFVARPAAVFAILGPFRDKVTKKAKYGFKAKCLISFVGLRGAASVVFIATALAADGTINGLVFDAIFVIVMLSIGIQGSLIPPVAKKLDMIDDTQDVMENFNDFSDNSEMRFCRIDISGHSSWRDKKIKDLMIPTNMVLVMILRGKEKIYPNGETELHKGDIVITGMRHYDDMTSYLTEKKVTPGSDSIGKLLSEVSNDGEILVMIRRGGRNIIPNGRTRIEDGDILVWIENN